MFASNNMQERQERAIVYPINARPLNVAVIAELRSWMPSTTYPTCSRAGA
jgi:hypothetical protein